MKHFALYGHALIISADRAILRERERERERETEREREGGEREHVHNDQLFLAMSFLSPQFIVTFWRWDFQLGAVFARGISHGSSESSFHDKNLPPKHWQTWQNLLRHIERYVLWRCVTLEYVNRISSFSLSLSLSLSSSLSLFPPLSLAFSSLSPSILFQINGVLLCRLEQFYSPFKLCWVPLIRMTLLPMMLPINGKQMNPGP